MARHFVRLKLTLLRNSLKIGGWQQAVGLGVGLLYAIPLTLGGFAGLALLRLASDDVAGIATVLAFVVLFLGWALVPLLTFSSDSALDPARLALLPLRRRELATGLFAASCVGIAPAATLLALAGAVVGLAPLGPGAPLVLAGAMVELALCVVVSRALTTGLSHWLRSRRARDLTIVATTVAALVLSLSVQVVARTAESGGLASPDWVRALTRSLGWSPPGMVARAIVAAGRGGSLVEAALLLLAGAAAVLLLAWWWYASLERVLTSVESAGRPRRARAARAGADRAAATVGLFPRLARPFLPRDPRGAVAGKDLRYYARHPQLRVQWLVTGVLSVLLPVLLIVGRGGAREGAALGALASLFMINSTSLNQFGWDAAAYATNVAAGLDPRRELAGKNLALALPALTLVAVIATVLALLGGGWLYLPVTLCLAAGGLGVTLGVANVTSVRFAYPLPSMATNLWASQGAGQSFTVGLVQLAALAVEGAVLLPLAGLTAAAILLWRPGLLLLCPLAVAYGYLFWTLGLRIGADWLRSHQPELLTSLSRKVA